MKWLLLSRSKALVALTIFSITTTPVLSTTSAELDASVSTNGTGVANNCTKFFSVFSDVACLKQITKKLFAPKPKPPVSSLPLGKSGKYQLPGKASMVNDWIEGDRDDETAGNSTALAFQDAPALTNETSPLVREYFQGNHSVEWLAKQVGFHNFSTMRLGLARNMSVRGIPALQALDLHRKQPQVARILTEAVELARSIDVFMTQLSIHFTSAAASLPTLLNAMTVSDDHTLAYFMLGTGTMLAATMLTVPSLQLPGIAVGAAVVGLEVVTVGFNIAALWGGPKKPPPEVFEGWATWSVFEMDTVTDIIYSAFRHLFEQGTPDLVRILTQEFAADHMRIHPTKFLYHFKTIVLQRLMNNRPKYFVNYQCTGLQCEDGYVAKRSNDTFRVTYKTKMSKRARKYLDAVPLNWDDYFEGNNGWNITQRTYRCKRHRLIGLHCTGPKPFEPRSSLLGRLFTWNW